MVSIIVLTDYTISFSVISFSVILTCEESRLAGYLLTALPHYPVNVYSFTEFYNYPPLWESC